MSFRQQLSSVRSDGAHGNMQGVFGKFFQDAIITQNGFFQHLVVRQHGDNYRHAIGRFGRRFAFGDCGLSELIRLRNCTVINLQVIARAYQIFCHRRTHVTQADEPYFVIHILVDVILIVVT